MWGFWTRLHCRRDEKTRGGGGQLSDLGKQGVSSKRGSSYVPEARSTHVVRHIVHYVTQSCREPTRCSSSIVRVDARQNRLAYRVVSGGLSWEQGCLGYRVVLGAGLSWEQGCLGYRVVSGTGLSRVQGCLGYRVVSGTGLSRVQGCLGYRVVSGTGLSRYRVVSDIGYIILCFCLFLFFCTELTYFNFFNHWLPDSFSFKYGYFR